MSCAYLSYHIRKHAKPQHSKLGMLAALACAHMRGRGVLFQSLLLAAHA